MKSLCYGILGLLAVLWAQNLLAGPVTQPTSQPGEMDPSLRRQLEEIDVRGARIQDLAAEFVQVKNTALLRKPPVCTSAPGSGITGRVPAGSRLTSAPTPGHCV